MEAEKLRVRFHSGSIEFDLRLNLGPIKLKFPIYLKTVIRNGAALLLYGIFSVITIDTIQNLSGATHFQVRVSYLLTLTLTPPLNSI